MRGQLVVLYGVCIMLCRLLCLSELAWQANLCLVETGIGVALEEQLKSVVSEQCGGACRLHMLVLDIVAWLLRRACLWLMSE